MNQIGFDSKKELKKAVIYVRVSTEEQVENYSLDNQIGTCSREAERRGIEVVQIFREEGRSAKNIIGRPVLIEMLEFCRKNKREIDALMVYRLDRLSRSTADYLAIRKKLLEFEISLISTSEPTGDSPTEKFVETMLAGFAQMDNDVRGERSRNGLRARFLAGLNTGFAPLGYLNQSGYVTKDPNTWDKVNKAWELMGSGMTTLRQMAEIMNEWGVKERHRDKEYQIRQQTINRIFRNKFYTGVIVSKKYGHEVQGQPPPMITNELFYRVQAVLDGRNTNINVALSRRNYDNPDFPLRRIVKCQRCGTPFSGAWSKGKHARYAYYFCKQRCGGPSVPIQTLHDAMVELLKKITVKPQTLDLVIAYMRKTYYQRVATLQKRRAEADTELKKCYELRQALIEKNLKGIYSDDIFRDQNRLIEERIKDVQATKDDALINKYNLEAITKFIKDKFENLAETYAQSDLEQKRVLVCSTMPLGALWNYPGLANTKISPYYQAILDIENPSDSLGADGGTRTHKTIGHWILSPTCIPFHHISPPNILPNLGQRETTIFYRRDNEYGYFRLQKSLSSKSMRTKIWNKS